MRCGKTRTLTQDMIAKTHPRQPACLSCGLLVPSNPRQTALLKTQDIQSERNDGKHMKTRRHREDVLRRSHTSIQKMIESVAMHSPMRYAVLVRRKTKTAALVFLRDCRASKRNNPSLFHKFCEIATYCVQKR